MSPAPYDPPHRSHGYHSPDEPYTHQQRWNPPPTGRQPYSSYDRGREPDRYDIRAHYDHRPSHHRPSGSLFVPVNPFSVHAIRRDSTIPELSLPPRQYRAPVIPLSYNHAPTHSTGLSRRSVPAPPPQSHRPHQPTTVVVPAPASAVAHSPPVRTISEIASVVESQLLDPSISEELPPPQGRAPSPSAISNHSRIPIDSQSGPNQSVGRLSNEILVCRGRLGPPFLIDSDSGRSRARRRSRSRSRSTNLGGTPSVSPRPRSRSPARRRRIARSRTPPDRDDIYESRLADFDYLNPSWSRSVSPNSRHPRGSSNYSSPRRRRDGESSRHNGRERSRSMEYRGRKRSPSAMIVHDSMPSGLSRRRRSKSFQNEKRRRSPSPNAYRPAPHLISGHRLARPALSADWSRRSSLLSDFINVGDVTECTKTELPYPIVTPAVRNSFSSRNIWGRCQQTIEVLTSVATSTIPRQIYLHVLLRVPALYFSRITRVFEDAEISMEDIKAMKQTPDYEVFDESWETGNRFRRAYPAIARFKISWDEFINTATTEWQVQNVLAVLLLSAVLSLLQIDSIGSDPVSRTAALLSLVCALMSLIYGCLYMSQFGTMKKLYKAAAWAEEAQNQRTSIFWNVWIFLAMPTVWLMWSTITFIICIISYVWRAGSNSDNFQSLDPKQALGPRIAITAVLALGLVYLVFVIRTLYRYGSVMDDSWRATLRRWRREKENTYPVFVPPRTLSSYPHSSSPFPAPVFIPASPVQHSIIIPTSRPPSHGIERRMSASASSRPRSHRSPSPPNFNSRSQNDYHISPNKPASTASHSTSSAFDLESLRAVSPPLDDQLSTTTNDRIKEGVRCGKEEDCRCPIRCLTMAPGPYLQLLQLRDDKLPPIFSDGEHTSKDNIDLGYLAKAERTIFVFDPEHPQAIRYVLPFIQLPPGVFDAVAWEDFINLMFLACSGELDVPNLEREKRLEIRSLVLNDVLWCFNEEHFHGRGTDLYLASEPGISSTSDSVNSVHAPVYAVKLRPLRAQ